jgi:hypothetical protein
VIKRKEQSTEDFRFFLTVNNEGEKNNEIEIRTLLGSKYVHACGNGGK